jgi:hypothetical protein
MDFTTLEQDGLTVLSGPPGQPLLRKVQDATLIVEACANHATRRVLLYAENLTPAFFDLSSREAGEILGKLRNYSVRLAVVYDPAITHFSTRWPDLMREENRLPYFHLFTDPAAAAAWLRQDASA